MTDWLTLENESFDLPQRMESQPDSPAHQPRIIPRAEHPISRSNVLSSALKVLYTLKDAGFQAYLVGGGVRDLLLGREPKDFDVATDALPDQVKDLFRSCRLIGRRFRLAHVRYGRDIIEVATFRATGESAEGDIVKTDEGRILRDNAYGTIETDAWRRDFTVNALYYNIRDFSVVDYTGGMQDLKDGVLRMIGNPAQRYNEDPVRMLRAVRFAAKLGFRVHPDSEKPIFELADRLQEIPPARLFEEVLKLFLGGAAAETYDMLRRYGLFKHLFPDASAVLSTEEQGFPHVFIGRALANTDERVLQGKPVTPAFLFAALLWEPLRAMAEKLRADGMDEMQALLEASTEVLRRQAASVAIPKRFTLTMREIWFMQPRLARLQGRRPAKLVEHPRFRAAYDFLVLRAEGGEPVAELAEWWTKFQTLPTEERESQMRGLGGDKPKKRRRRRKKPQSDKD